MGKGRKIKISLQTSTCSCNEAHHQLLAWLSSLPTRDQEKQPLQIRSPDLGGSVGDEDGPRQDLSIHGRYWGQEWKEEEERGIGVSTGHASQLAPGDTPIAFELCPALTSHPLDLMAMPLHLQEGNYLYSS